MNRVQGDRGRSHHECPYCAEELEQWSISFRRADRTEEQHQLAASRFADARPEWPSSREMDGGPVEGLTLLSLCPTAGCGYYVLRYGSGPAHWDRDVEAARLLRTMLSSSQ